MTKPVAFQEINGKRVQVAANYTLSEKSGNTYGFQVGEYDKTRPLVIDPLAGWCGEQLITNIYSTFKL